MTWEIIRPNDGDKGLTLVEGEEGQVRTKIVLGGDGGINEIHVIHRLGAATFGDLEDVFVELDIEGISDDLVAQCNAVLMEQGVHPQYPKVVDARMRFEHGLKDIQKMLDEYGKVGPATLNALLAYRNKLVNAIQEIQSDIEGNERDFHMDLTMPPTEEDIRERFVVE